MVESFGLQGGSKRLIIKCTDHRLSKRPRVLKICQHHLITATSATSANAVELDVSTGAPQTIASNTGTPNPSYNEGKTNRSVEKYNSYRLFVDNRPRQSTFSVKLCLRAVSS
jgi:hypothetical protein